MTNWPSPHQTSSDFSNPPYYIRRTMKIRSRAVCQSCRKRKYGVSSGCLLIRRCFVSYSDFLDQDLLIWFHPSAMGNVLLVLNVLKPRKHVLAMRISLLFWQILPVPRTPPQKLHQRIFRHKQRQCSHPDPPLNVSCSTSPLSGGLQRKMSWLWSLSISLRNIMALGRIFVPISLPQPSAVLG